MVALGDADGMVSGTTRNYSTVLEDVKRCIDVRSGHRMIGVSIVLARGRTVLVADTAVHDMPNSEQLADIAEEAAGLARRLGYEPRVAMLAYSTFGHPSGERSDRVIEAVKILDRRRVDFEYDGEMAADVALNPKVMEQYPFCRLSGTANVLVMPAFHSASISTKMLQELGGSTVIGPILVGLEKSVQIVPIGARTATSSTWPRLPPIAQAPELWRAVPGAGLRTRNILACARVRPPQGRRTSSSRGRLASEHSFSFRQEFRRGVSRWVQSC